MLSRPQDRRGYYPTQCQYLLFRNTRRGYTCQLQCFLDDMTVEVTILPVPIPPLSKHQERLTLSSCNASSTTSQERFDHPTSANTSSSETPGEVTTQQLQCILSHKIDYHPTSSNTSSSETPGEVTSQQLQCVLDHKIGEVTIYQFQNLPLPKHEHTIPRYWFSSKLPLTTLPTR